VNRADVRARIDGLGIIPAIRVTCAEDALFAAESVSRGGIPIVEVTMTVPGALGVVAELLRTQPELTVGAGTVLDAETAQCCVDAGVHFLTSPGLHPAVMEVAGEAAIHVSTPQEMAEAMKAIAANPRLRNVLSGCGLERASAFSWSRTARETHDIYASVLFGGVLPAGH